MATALHTQSRDIPVGSIEVTGYRKGINKAAY
jgi:hypothetical protein